VDHRLDHQYSPRFYCSFHASIAALNLSFFGVVSSWPTGLIHGCRSFHVENMTNLQGQGWRFKDTSRTLEETFDSLIFDTGGYYVVFFCGMGSLAQCEGNY
jgi:hypothetical protein